MIWDSQIDKRCFRFPNCHMIVATRTSCSLQLRLPSMRLIRLRNDPIQWKYVTSWMRTWPLPFPQMALSTPRSSVYGTNIATTRPYILLQSTRLLNLLSQPVQHPSLQPSVKIKANPLVDLRLGRKECTCPKYKTSPAAKASGQKDALPNGAVYHQFLKALDNCASV